MRGGGEWWSIWRQKPPETRMVAGDGGDLVMGLIGLLR
jgi:hypothetical protein